MENPVPTRIHYAALTFAAVVVVLAGARYAQAIVVPFLLSLFIATILATPVEWLHRRGFPLTVALAVVILILVLIFFVLGMLVGVTVDEFARALPLYQERLKGLSDAAVAWLRGRGIEVPEGGLLGFLDLRVVMTYANTLLTALGAMLGNAVIIIFTVFFLLLEAWSFPAKVAAIHGEQGEELVARIGAVIRSTKHYTAAKTLTSVATGILVWLGTWAAGLDFAPLWGLIAFLFNYVPNIGSILAAIPAVILALVQLGVGGAIGVGAIYLAINVLIGNIIEPRLMGRWMGLSTLVVFVSLFLWGWLLGPVGMLLSVPLTMVVKFAAEVHEDTRWIAVLLGPAPERRVPDEVR